MPCLSFLMLGLSSEAQSFNASASSVYGPGTTCWYSWVRGYGGGLMVLVIRRIGSYQSGFSSEASKLFYKRTRHSKICKVSTHKRRVAGMLKFD